MNAAITDSADASAWCCCARCKYTKELADAKAENDALADDVAAGRRRLHIKAVCQAAWSHHVSGVDNAAPDWQTPLNGIISPSERGWSLCKNNWKEPRSILMSRQIELPISMGNSCNYCEQYTRFQRSINVSKVIKPRTIYECLLFLFNNIFCAANKWDDRQFFFCPIPETKKWWVMASFGATAAGLFWTVNVCWAHPVLAGPCSSE